MSRLATLVPLLAAAVLLVFFASIASTHTARTKLAEPPAARAAAPARPAALNASSRAATVTSADFTFSAAAIDAPAGTLKLTLTNAGPATHELVLLKSSADPAGLKVAANGRVSEAAGVGEVSEIKSGVTKSTTFHLQPGRYIYVCNIPGHYAAGMHGVLVVR